MDNVQKHNTCCIEIDSHMSVISQSRLSKSCIYDRHHPDYAKQDKIDLALCQMNILT
jgi:hypothetical protein